MGKLELLKKMRSGNENKEEFDRVITIIENGIINNMKQVIVTPVANMVVDEALTRCGFKTSEPTRFQQIVLLD